MSRLERTEDWKVLRKGVWQAVLKARKSPSEADSLLMRELEKRGLKYKYKAWFHDSKVGYSVDFFLKNVSRLALEISDDVNPQHGLEEKVSWLKENRKCQLVMIDKKEIYDDVMRVCDRLEKVIAQ